jgi:hypothetical protein
VKLTLRVLPKTVVTAVAVVVPFGGPDVAGFKVTMTFAAGMLPFGKPEPVTVRLVIPAWPALGDVGELRVTVVWASTGVSGTQVRRLTKTPAVPDRMYRHDLIGYDFSRFAAELLPTQSRRG